jgi:DNA replication initiation complex subunit (GINS family)
MMTDINITYETLYELLRTEKNREDLQELSSEFYNDVIIYINKNKDMLDEAIAKDANDEEVEARVRQLKNIKNLMKEIYERREKKILNLAISKSRTKSENIDSDLLLPPERELYEQLVKTLDLFRSEVLMKTLGGNTPYNNIIEPSNIHSTYNKPNVTLNNKEHNLNNDNNESNETKKETSNLNTNQNPVNTSNTRDIIEKNKEQNKNQDISLKNRLELQIKFKENVPKFLGKELEVYGPYETDDTTTLPTELAHILIKKGKAEEVNN